MLSYFALVLFLFFLFETTILANAHSFVYLDDNTVSDLHLFLCSLIFEDKIQLSYGS